MSSEVNLEERAILTNQVLEFFSDAVKVLGLPKSVGELYGILFISKEALSLDDMVERLGMSKGGASQGLKMLRTLGAVREVEGMSGRKVFYEADAELKSLVGGFIREEVRPHLDSAKLKIERMRTPDVEADEFYSERVDKLDKWRKRAGLVLPILQKILRS